MQRKISYLSEKVVSRETLIAIVQVLKQQGKIIVTTNGSFDLLHIGHVTMLQEAKSLGDVLIVGLNSDTSVRSYKGKYRPICPQEHRAAMLAALVCTDYITIFDELTPVPLLEVIQPDIHVNSLEHGYECVEHEVVARYGGRIHLAQLVEEMSTSLLLERILEVASHTPRRGIFINGSDLLDPGTVSSRTHDIPETTFSALHQFSTKGFQIFLLASGTEITKEHDIVETLRQRGIEISLLSSIESAGREFDLILAKSFIISSNIADIQMGRELNCKTVLLRRPSNTQEGKSATAGSHVVVHDLQEVVAVVDDG